MKKLFIAIIAVLSVVSCKKETKTITQVNPETGKTETIEVPVTQEDTRALKDSAGIYKLAYKLETGKTYPFISVQTDASTVSDGKQTMSGSQETIDEMSFTVNGFSGGVYDLTLNLISKKVSVTQDGKTITADTRQAAPKDEQAKITWNMNKAFAGGKLAVKMKNTGEILSVAGFEDIYKKVDKVLADAIKDNAELQKEASQNFKQGFGEAAMKEMLEKNLKIFPEKGVKIGESWSNSENITPDGKLKLNTTYTLSKAENGTAAIAVKGDIPPHSEKQTPQQGVTYAISMKGTQSGTINLDENTGWMQKSTLAVNTTQTESLTMNGQTQKGTRTTKSTTVIN